MVLSPVVMRSQQPGAGAEPRLRRALLGTVGPDLAQRALVNAQTARGSGLRRAAAPELVVAEQFRSAVQSVGSFGRPALVHVSRDLPEIDERLPNALAELPLALRTPLWLAYGCGWSLHEIALATDVDEPTARSMTGRALRRLQKTVDADELQLHLYAVHMLTQCSSSGPMPSPAQPETFSLDSAEFADVVVQSGQRQRRFAVGLAVGVVLLLGGMLVPIGRGAEHPSRAIDVEGQSVGEPPRQADPPSAVPDRRSADAPLVEINLDELAASSNGLRVAELGPIPTFDFEQLPDGWRVESVSAGFVVTSEFSENERTRSPRSLHRHVVVIAAPDGESVTVNVTGLADRSASPLVRKGPMGPFVIRGHSARFASGSIEWLEGERTLVRVRAGHDTQVMGSDDFSRAMALADLLVPASLPVSWGLAASGTSVGVTQNEPSLLGGTLGPAVWRVFAADDDTHNGRIRLVANRGDDAVTHATSRTHPRPEGEVAYSIAPFGPNGDVVLFGVGPKDVASVRFIAQSETVTLPVVELGSDRAVFAVPISHRVDPMSIEFLNDHAEVLGSADLRDVPPYLINPIDDTLVIEGCLTKTPHVDIVVGISLRCSW